MVTRTERELKQSRSWTEMEQEEKRQLNRNRNENGTVCNGNIHNGTVTKRESSRTGNSAKKINWGFKNYNQNENILYILDHCAILKIKKWKFFIEKKSISGNWLARFGYRQGFPNPTQPKPNTRDFWLPISVFRICLRIILKLIVLHSVWFWLLWF